MQNAEIKGTDSIGYADYLHIVFGERHVEYFPEDALNTTFNEVLSVARENGYKDEYGTILLIAESPLNGVVYRYGNYGAYWVEIGKTMGYA